MLSRERAGERLINGDNVTVQGNYIGLNSAGTAAIPMSGTGIIVSGASAVIGGTTPSEGNVIS